MKKMRAAIMKKKIIENERRKAMKKYEKA